MSDKKNVEKVNTTDTTTNTTKTDAPLTMEQELLRKVEYHRNCIAKLEKQLEDLKKPTRKQMSDLLSKCEGMTMEDIAAKLGINLA